MSETLTKAEWLIQDGHTGMWWRPGGNGYTHDTLEAGLFSEEKAKSCSSPAYADRRDRAVHMSELQGIVKDSAVWAALPPPVGTCATCSKWTREMAGMPHGVCAEDVRHQPYRYSTVETFGCTLHSPLPPAAPGGEG